VTGGNLIRCRGEKYFAPTFAGAAIALFFFVLSVRVGIAQDDPNEKLPMFGQPGIVRSDALKERDEAVIREAALRYGNRSAASRALAAEGWTAARRGVFDVAMNRFNQAWLLNPKNYQAFWGFGAILSERGKLVEALEQLETARSLIDDNAQRAALLSDMGAVCSEYAARMSSSRALERAQFFIKANNLFTESLENNPNFAAGWREWAISLYEQERYSEAWVKAQRAQELRAEPFPENFLAKLREKVPQAK
jgi:tetratricopeptide (TPR) repeat protein